MIEKLFHRVIRRMGYISDQSGIYDRYARETENWKAHLEKTKQYIRNFILKNQYKTVSVLGSGWLLDIPLDFLSSNLEKAVLYDVNHPVQIRQKLRKYHHFKLVTADITGGLINSAYDAVKIYRRGKTKTLIKDLRFSGFRPTDETDCYISLNILNQLDIVIIDYLNKYRIYSTEELNSLRTAIQQSHLDTMPENKSCLITDYEEVVSGNEGRPSGSKSLLYTVLPEGKNILRWEWPFDTTGSYNKGFNTVFKVIAMEI